MPPTCLSFESSDGSLLSAAGVPCVIGRSACCSIRLASPEISRRHAVILRDGRDWWLVDCGSRGGTWLNQTRISTGVKLAHGDFIGLGLTILKFIPCADPRDSFPTAGPIMETTRPGDVEWVVTTETAVAWVDDDGGIRSLTPAAELWLNAFFGGVKDGFPPCLFEWLQGPSALRVPYERKVGEERLRLHVCHDAKGDRLLVMTRLKAAFGEEVLRRIGLSRAEALLVPWLIRGKRNEEMAMIVGVAPKTVEKQVSSILLKLKVETRTAAAWSIIELTGAHW